MQNSSNNGRIYERRFLAFRFLVGAASLVVLIAGLKAAQTLMLPLLFATFLAILGSSPLAWFQRIGMPKVPAVLLVTILIMGILIGVGMLLGNSLNEFSKSLPDYQQELDLGTRSLAEWFQERGIEVSSSELFESVEPGALLDIFVGALRGLVGAASKTLLVIIIMVFALVEAADLKQKVAVATGKSFNVERLQFVARDVQRYLTLKTFTSALTGTLVGVWVTILGIDFPILWAVIAFILNYIPFIGSIVAAIPAVMLAITQVSLQGAIVTAIGYTCINIGISNFFEPVLMGRRLGISALVVFLSLVFWGWVWGPGGMLLSVPLTMVVKIFLEHSRDFHWIAVLMDPKPGLLKGDNEV